MNALGSSVDLKTLDDEAIKCMLTPQMLEQLPPGADVTVDMITCPSATAREANIENYKHESKHLQIALAALLGQFILFIILTIVVQTRKKID